YCIKVTRIDDRECTQITLRGRRWRRNGGRCLNGNIPPGLEICQRRSGRKRSTADSRELPCALTYSWHRIKDAKDFRRRWIGKIVCLENDCLAALPKSLV